MTKEVRDFKVDMRQLSRDLDEMLIGLDLDGPQADKYRRYGIDIDERVADAKKRHGIGD